MIPDRGLEKRAVQPAGRGMVFIRARPKRMSITPYVDVSTDRVLDEVKRPRAT
jgi:hypothetical protein